MSDKFVCAEKQKCDISGTYKHGYFKRIACIMHKGNQSLRLSEVATLDPSI